MMERKGVLQLGEQDVSIVGPDIEVGQSAPEFTAHDQFFSDVDVLESTKGKVRILSAVFSLETDVCDRETRRFNEEAAALGDDVAIVTISTDLPFTQKRWCGAAGIENVMVVSDHMDTDFGVKYGTLIKERRQLRRAVFVVDADEKVVYADYMPVLGQEPNYGEVLEAARRALGQ